MALRPETLPRNPDRLIEMMLACEGKIEALEATIPKLRAIIFGATKNNRLDELLVWNWKAAREAEKVAA